MLWLSREKLRKHLEQDFGSKKNWEHITNQVSLLLPFESFFPYLF